MKTSLTISFAAACLVGSAVRADEGRIPIYQPTTITQSGHYVLTRDISLTGGDGITIMTDDVTIDLNGHTIHNAPTFSAIVVSGGVRGIVVRNGFLVGGEIGISGFASGTANISLSVENVEMRDTFTAGLEIINAGDIEVVSCRVINSNSFGIIINAPSGMTFGGRFIDNVVDISGNSGIVLQTPRAVEIRRNIVTRFGTTTTGARGLLLGGSAIDGGGNTVEGNVIRGGNDDVGMVIGVGPNSLIVDNVVSSTGGYGIDVLTSGNRFVGNVVSACSKGMVLETSAEHNAVERNHFEANRNEGVVINGSYTLLDNNTCAGNLTWGFAFIGGTGNAYRGNMLRHNSNGAVTGSATDAGGNIL